MSKPAKLSKSTSVTKPNIITKYNDLVDAYNAQALDIQTLQTQLKDARKVTKVPAPIVQKPQPPAAKSEDISTLDGIKMVFSNTVESVNGLYASSSARMLSRVAILHSSKAQLEAAVKQINKLYDINVSITGSKEVKDDKGNITQRRVYSLDEAVSVLVDQYTDLEDNFNEKLEGMQDDFDDKYSAAETDMKSANSERNKFEDNRRVEYRLTQSREQAEYDYIQKQQATADAEKIEEQNRLRTEELETLSQTAQTKWEQEEEEISGAERKQTAVRISHANLEQRCAGTVRTAEKIVEDSTNKAHRTKAELLSTEVQSAQEAVQMRINALEAEAADQAANNTVLQASVTNAQERSRTLAEKAIDGASGNRALTHVKELATEFARNTKK